MSYEFDPNEVSGTPKRRTGIANVRIVDAFDLLQMDLKLPANKEKIEKLKLDSLITKVRNDPKNIAVLQVLLEVDGQQYRKIIYGGQKTMWKIGNLYAATGVFANKPRDAKGKVKTEPADLIGRQAKTLFFVKGKYTDVYDLFPLETPDNVVQATFDTDDWLQNKIRESAVPADGAIPGVDTPADTPAGATSNDEPLPF
jgi:hypothetical protein